MKFIDTDLFSDEQNPSLIKQVVPGKLLILDFSSVDSLRKTNFSFFTWKKVI